MNLRRPNSNEATRTTNRSRSVVPMSGICTRCIDGCTGNCEVFKASFRSRELIYPGPFGEITAGGDYITMRTVRRVIRASLVISGSAHGNDIIIIGGWIFDIVAAVTRIAHGSNNDNAGVTGIGNGIFLGGRMRAASTIVDNMGTVIGSVVESVGHMDMAGTTGTIKCL